MLGFWPREEHILFGRGGAGDKAEEDLTVESQAFVAKETAKCRVMVGGNVGGGELGKQVVQYMADSAAPCIMTPDAGGRTNFR